MREREQRKARSSLWEGLPSFHSSFIQQIITECCMPGTVLVAWDRDVNKTDKNLSSKGSHTSRGGRPRAVWSMDDRKCHGGSKAGEGPWSTRVEAAT